MDSFSPTQILGIVGTTIYVALGLAAMYGLFCVILLVRRIAQKRFSGEAAAERFLDEVRDQLTQKNYDGITEMCDSPPYWSKAVPQLIMLAVENRNREISKLRRLLAERFERDILADLDYRMSWVSTIVKSAPMLGLLGTVVGMIGAFAKIADKARTGADVSALADDISFALFTTAVGLTIAIPLVLAGNMLSVRIGKLQDSVQYHLGNFLDNLDTIVKARWRRES